MRISKIGIVSRIARFVYIMLHYILIMQLTVCALEWPLLGVKEIAVLGTCVAISYFMREKLTRIIAIVIIHVALAVGIFYIIGPGIPKWTLIVLILIETFPAGKYMQSGYRLSTVFDIPWPSFLLCLGVLATGLYEHEKTLVSLCFIMAVLIYLVYILMVYLQNLENYIYMMKNVSAMPVDRIIPMNTIVVCCIFVTMIVVVILANLLGFNDALKAFGRGLLSGLRILFRVFVILYKIFCNLFAPDNTGKNGYERDVIRIEEEIQGSTFFEDLFLFVLKLLLIALAVFLVLRLFKKIYDTVLEKRARLDSDLVSRVDKPDMKNTKKEKIVREKGESRFTMEQRARRIYKKRVQSVAKKYTPRRVETTADIAEAYLKAQKELKKEERDIEELTELYEAVRYGNVKPDADYLKKMQKV